MPLYVYDWITDERIRLMSWEQRGIYMGLLMHQWVEGSVPADPQAIIKLLAIDGVAIETLLAPIRNCFVVTDGRMVNTRLEEVRSLHTDKSNKCREAGLRGAKRRWGGDSNQNQNQNQNQNNTRTPIRQPTLAGGCDVEWQERVRQNAFPKRDVEKIYKCYPRKVGKQAALKAISRALQKADYHHLLDATTRYADSWAGKQGRYTPHPATWFNQGRYDDDPAEWQEPKDDADHPPGHDPDWRESLPVRD